MFRQRTNAAAPHFSDANCGLLRKWRPKTVPLDRTLARAYLISICGMAAMFGNSLKNECAQIFSVVVSPTPLSRFGDDDDDDAAVCPTQSVVERRLPRNPVFAAYPTRPKYS